MVSEWKLPEDVLSKYPRFADQELAAGYIFQYANLYNFGFDNGFYETDFYLGMIRGVEVNADEKRKITLAQQRKAIKEMATPQDAVKIMKSLDTLLYDQFYQKAFGMDLADLLIDKLRTNGIHQFIASAYIYLALADEKHIDRVAKEFREFRNPYARALATVLLAYRKRKESLKDIYEEYLDSLHYGSDIYLQVVYAMQRLTEEG